MLIFLSGPDTFRSRHKLRQIKERFRREVDKAGYNTSILDGTRLKVEEFERDVLAAPFLAPKRMVVVERFFCGKPPAAAEKKLEEILQRPAAEATVTVFWEGELPGGSRKPGPLLHRLRSSPYAETFPLLSGRDLERWYRQHAQRLELNLTAEALTRLSELVGDDLWRADRELQKLSAYCHGRAATRADVQTLVSDQAEENVFAFTDALGQRRTADALRLLEENRRAGVNALELLSKITWHWRNLLAAKSWIETNGRRPSSWELASALQLHPFVAQKTLGQVGNFTLAELTARYRQLAAIDRRMKSGSDPQILLTLMVAGPADR